MSPTQRSAIERTLDWLREMRMVKGGIRARIYHDLNDALSESQPSRMPSNEAEIQQMRAEQALSILELLNAHPRNFYVRAPAAENREGWQVSGAGLVCQGVTLTDALAQFTTAVSL